MVLGKIYKIVVAQSNDIYIGSTFDNLAQRFKNHKNQYKLWKDGKNNNCASFDLFDKYGIDNCKALLIKEYDVVDRKHLEMYEQLWINRLCNVNKHAAFRIKKLYMKQYDEERKEQKAEYSKKWYEEHKEEKKKYNKKWREGHDEHCKRYREERKEKQAEYGKKWYEEHIDTLKQKRKEKITCEICKCEITRNGKSHHERTKKHLNNSNIQINNNVI
jgi:hypothetical protein